MATKRDLKSVRRPSPSAGRTQDESLSLGASRRSQELASLADMEPVEGTTPSASDPRRRSREVHKIVDTRLADDLTSLPSDDFRGGVVRARGANHTMRDDSSSADDRSRFEAHVSGVVSDQPSDHITSDTHQSSVARLVFLCRVRTQILQARNRFGNQLDAMERLRTGELKGRVKTKREPTPDDIAVALATRTHLEPFVSPFDALLRNQDKEIESVARELPVYAFTASVRGFGAKGLGLIIGASGDLSRYANPAKLWKRMGLGMVGNERQRKVTNVVAALEHGYSPRRRSLMHVVGDSLLKQNGRGGDGYYRKVYDDRKAYTEANRPQWTKAHRHMDAMRYMEKRLLRHLWQAWKRTAAGRLLPGEGLPSWPELDAEAAFIPVPEVVVPQRPASDVEFEISLQASAAQNVLDSARQSVMEAAR